MHMTLKTVYNLKKNPIETLKYSLLFRVFKSKWMLDFKNDVTSYFKLIISLFSLLPKIYILLVQDTSEF